MKTKIKYLLWWLVFFAFWLQVNANLIPADALEISTSGIKYSYYEVTWCSPHATRLADNRFKTAPCQKWYFYNDSWVWKMTYKWENFSNGNVKLNTNFPWITRTTTTWIIDFFSWINSIAFEWEWTYTLRILLVDHAYNASKFEFSYKIDKTAPQFQLTGITEDHENIFVSKLENEKRLTWLSGSIVKYDSNNETSDDRDTYKNPMIQNYTGPIPIERSWHTRQDLYVMYFKWWNTANDLANHPFQLKVTYSDKYGSHMNWYLSEEKNFSLHKENGDVIKEWIALWNILSLSTADLQSNNSLNSQAKYKLRLYDKTVGKDTNKRPNYSEIIFYAVRDNTKPNMWVGLATTETEAIKKLLKFDENNHVWDNDATSQVSKFISAKTNQSLHSVLQETWITGNNSNPAWYNAWVPLWWWTKISIEKADRLNDFDDTIIYKDRFNNYKNNTIKDKNFSQVDNNRKNGYRNYLVHFNTDQISWNNKICDNVWNCLEPQLDFRVVANVLHANTANVSLSFIADNPLTPKEIFANWKDKYKLTTNLKDQYWNAIVWVTAKENQNKIIKNVDIAFNFKNDLYYNQLINEGEKWVIIQDLHPAKHSTSNITDTKVYFIEKAESNSEPWKGTYELSIASNVPSLWAYPYLKNDSVFKLTNIFPKAFLWTGGIDKVWIYPPTNVASALWFFSQNNHDLKWDDNFLSTNIDFLKASDYHTDLEQSEKSRYWIVTLKNANDIRYNTLNWRKLELDFASPAIYWAENLTLHHLINTIWATSTHKKYAYKLWGLINDPTIFEQYLPSYTWATVERPKFTPDIFNIFSNLNDGTELSTGSIINNGTWITYSSTLFNKDYQTKSSPIDSEYKTQWYWFNMWYISSISYTMSWIVQIPSISRNVSNNPSTDPQIADKNSKYYFPAGLVTINNKQHYVWNWDYVILWDPIINTGIEWALWIAVTWLTNQHQGMIIDQEKWRKANLNVWENLTKYDMMTLFKKNVVLNTAWFAKDNNKKWCDWITITDLNNVSGVLNNCTIKLNWETISFIKWNLDIECSNDNTCILNNTKRTIVVQDGSTYIKSNITTFGKNSQLLIGTIANTWLKNISIPDNSLLSRDATTIGWTFIDPSVTNIDSFIVSQWPIVSYDDGKVFMTPTDTDLKNQLHIYGSTLSLNTIGWYKWATNDKDDSKCPYIIQNCNQKTAFIFDLVHLRKYSLEGTQAWSSLLSPSGWWKRSGGNTSKLTSENKIITQADTNWYNGLRYISDKDYIIYPLFVERDVSWNKSPSTMFRSDK